MKGIPVLIFVCSLFYSLWMLPEYRVDPWNGIQSDASVRKKGYTYYFCDQQNRRCYAVYLTKQDRDDLLRVLTVNQGKTVEDSIAIVKRDSEMAANVLRDFKEYRGINQMRDVLSILKHRRR